MVSNFHKGFIFVLFSSQDSLAKIKTAKCSLPMCRASESCFNLALLQTMYLAVLTIIEACQWVWLWRLLLRSIGKSKCYVSIDQRTGRWRRVESGNNRLYEQPPHIGTKSWDCNLSLLTILDIRSALAVQQANTQVPDSQSAKNKTAKISEARIWACFTKICTRENY